MKNPADVAKKWSQNLGSAGQSIAMGVQSVTVNPAEQAAQQADLAVRKYAAAKDKMVAGLQRTTLQGWQQAMIKKGVARISEGAAQAQPKVAQFMAQLLPAVAAAQASLPPRGDQASNEQRMLQFSRSMKQFKRS
jgi:hypothetical protein